MRTPAPSWQLLAHPQCADAPRKPMASELDSSSFAIGTIPDRFVAQSLPSSVHQRTEAVRIEAQFVGAVVREGPEAGPVVDNRDRQAACGMEVGAAERVENGGEPCRKSGCIAVQAPGSLGHCNTTAQRPDTGRRREAKLETAWSQLMMIDTKENT